MLNFVKRSLSIELSDFSILTGLITGKGVKFKKSAFCQARKKIRYEFFIDLVEFFNNLFYQSKSKSIKRWNGYRLIGFDGSKFSIINKKEIIDYFSQSIRDHAQALVMCGYDVLNNIGLFNSILPIETSEISVAIEWISKLKNDMLGLYDRGYAGFAFIYLLLEKKKKFVIRCSKTFNKPVIDFVNSGKETAIIKFKISYKSLKRLKKLGIKLDKYAFVTVRLVRVILDDGEVEILITNLYDCKKYKAETFKELYFYRWGVETYFDRLKNKFQIEIFSGQSVESIYQDFYANIFLSNLQSSIIGYCEPELKKINNTRKYDYQINWNISIGLMKNRIVQIFLIKNPKEVMDILSKLKENFLEHLEPIRPNRKFKREKKSQKLNGKYITFTNYKRAI